MVVQDCMTSDCVTIQEDASLNECVDLMEKKKIRRILVVDSFGKCCGIVSQADIALTGDKKKTGEVVQKVFRTASRFVGATLVAVPSARNSLLQTSRICR
jgi:CBS-domain-containing membrane protein